MGFGGRRLLRKEKKGANFIPWQELGTWKKQSFSCIYLWTGFKHTFVNVTSSAKTEKHTQIKAHIRDTKTQQV